MSGLTVQDRLTLQDAVAVLRQRAHHDAADAGA
jgi:hypothetical protein